MSEELEHLIGRRVSRRTLLRFGALTGLGVAATALIGACGGDDDDEPTTPPATPTSAAAAPTATPAAPVGVTPTAALSGTTVSSSDLPAVATANAGKQPKSGGTLIWGMGGDADALDPHTTNAWAAWRQATFMYESLVRKDLLSTDLNVAIVPQLAEKWELSDDGLKLTFGLRQGVKFHDGTDFNAAAVQANYERCWVPESEYYYSGAWHGAIAFPYVASTEMPDDYTFVFNLTEPFVEFLAAIGDYYWFGIASPTQIKKVGNENLAANPSGTGPFKFVERVEGDHTTVERFDDYWGEKAYLDRLIVRPILDDAARVVALQNGEIDLMSDPPPDTIPDLERAGFKLSIGNASQVAYYNFNFRNEYGKNDLVRRAISLAVDRQSIASNLFRDTVIPAYGLHTPGAPAYDPTWKPVEFNPERARELLAEAGYPNGFKTQVWAAPTASGWPLAGATAQLIQSNLKDIGIEIELKLTEWVTYLGLDFRNPDVLMYGTAWGMPTNFFVNILTESTYNTAESTFSTGYNEIEAPREDIDSLLKAAKAEPDPEKSNELYKQANEKICVEDVAVLCLNHDKFPHLMAPYVYGFVHAVNVNYDMSKVWLDK